MDDAFDDGARDLAASLRRPGMLQIVHDGGMAEVKEFDTDGTQSHGLLGRSLRFEWLEGVRRIAGTAVVVVEALVLDTGEYEVGFSGDLDSLSPARLVIDRTYRPPGHPPTAVAGPVAERSGPTDPDLVDAVRQLVVEYIELSTRVMGVAPEFGPACSEEDIAEAETRMGLRLPADLRALYRTVGDDQRESGLLGNYFLMPLDLVVADYLDDPPGVWAGIDDVFLEGAAVQTDARVRPVFGSDRWVTIASDNAWNFLAIDLDPTETGTVGQVIAHGRDTGVTVHYVAASVRDLLTRVVTDLRAGPGSDSDAGGPVPAFDLNAHVWIAPMRGRDLAAALAEVDDPLAIQEAYLNDAAELDLADLAPLRNLHTLAINRAGTVRLGLPEHIPVESLSIDAAGADLASLTGLDTLWDLTVRGVKEPVDARGLVRLPALARLDLSEVTVDNAPDLADLPELRVLTLSPAQWRELSAADRLPSHLAAAVLAGFARLPDAAAWADTIAARYGAPSVRSVIRRGSFAG